MTDAYRLRQRLGAGPCRDSGRALQRWTHEVRLVKMHSRLIDGLWRRMDDTIETSSRFLARTTSRRSVLRRLGTLLTGVAALPLLPIARGFAAESVNELGDPQGCDYWRHCALSGTLCACCGGTFNSCPPGSEPSPVTWIGTCHNPVDDRDYLISYADCCGKAICGRCQCHNTERERPVYDPSKSNSVLWCFGTESREYHCTISVVLGVADGKG